VRGTNKNEKLVEDRDNKDFVLSANNCGSNGRPKPPAGKKMVNSREIYFIRTQMEFNGRLIAFCLLRH